MVAPEQNYWPGFVDALSNVVLTLIFVLVVFVMALLITSNKVEKRAMELVKSSQEQKVSKDPKIELQKALDKALAKIKELKEENQLAKQAKQDLLDQQKVLDKKFVSSKIGEQIKSNFIAIERRADKIILSYPLDIAALDTKALKEFDKVLNTVSDKLLNHKVMINSYLGNEAYTSARRLAYYRILNIRNRLISQKHSTNSSIESHIIEGKKQGGARVEIVFK